MLRFPQYILQTIWKKITYILELIDLLISALESFFIKRKERKIIFPILLKQILFTGFDALKLIGVIALVMGGLVLFIADSLSQALFFDENLLGTMMSQLILRELAPLFTAIIVIGRSATAIATELGNMKVNHEIEAIETLGIDPIHYLIAPRILGMLISLIFLVIYFFFIALVGGYIFSNSMFGLRMPFDEYLYTVFRNMSFSDIGMALLKTFFFGIFISAIACYKGLKIQRSITFVPVVATQTVVSSMTTTFFLYAYFTIIFFL